MRKVTIGTARFYEDAEGNLLPEYAVGQSYKLKRPPGVGPEEKWVHVDLSVNTLVAYAGDRPVFTTIISTGKEPGMTPVGDPPKSPDGLALGPIHPANTGGSTRRLGLHLIVPT